LAACSSLPSIGPRTANGLPTHVDGGAGQILRFCEKMRDAGDLTTAAAACERAHRLDPSAPEPLLELASILGDMDEPDLSIAAYRTILKTSPANADARYGLGRTYLNQGQNDLALVEFQAALSSNPRDPRLYAAVGVANGLLGAHAEAQRVFRKGLAVAPQDTALRNNLGLSLVQTGRYDQGLLILETLAKDSNAEQASRDNLLVAQGLAATARAEIMLAEAQAEAEAEALARAAALEAAKPKTADRIQAPPENLTETAKVASAPAVLDFSFPQGSWPMDGPGESGVTPMASLAARPNPNEARQQRIGRALADRPDPAPRPLTAPTALIKSMAPPPASATAAATPRAQAAKTPTQAAQAPRSLMSLKGRQTARADFGATSDAGAAMNNAPEATAPSGKGQQAMPAPNRPAATMSPPSAPSTAKPAGDAYTVQFASYTSEERAWRGWDALRGAANGLLNDIEPDVRRADLGGGMGTVYRLRTQPAPRLNAKTLCSALKAKGVDCLVMKSEPEIADSSTGSGPATL
jgi:Tfp pilus assembly protein PilF